MVETGKTQRARRRFWTVGLGSVLGAISLAGEAHAQASTSSEIVVTATRRAQSLADVPAAVSALGGDQMQARRVEDVEDLSLLVPNVNFASSTGVDQGFVNIRGSFAGAADGPGVDLGVSVYVDDVYTNGPGDVPRNFFDIERVEVLRGPQGTLFGRNVTGGLIAFHTRAPSFEPSIDAELTAGNFGLVQSSAVLTGPLVGDVLAGKISLFGMQRDGYAENVYTGETDEDQSGWTGRAQLLWRPSNSVDLRIGAEIVEDDNEAPALRLLGTAPLPGYPATSFDFDKTNQGDAGFNEREQENGFATLNWDTGFGTLTAIAGYRHNEIGSRQTSLGDPLPIFTVGVAEEDELWSQEVRFASDTDERLSWIVGVYHIDSTRERREAVVGGLLGGFGPTYQHQIIDLNGWAVFADGTLKLTDALSVAAGVRYTNEEKEGETEKDGLIFSGTGALQSASYSESWESVTPRLVVSFAPTEDALLYASASRGFKGGGFDFGGDFEEDFGDAYDPESVWSYELGARLNWLEDALTTNVVLYRQDYKDLQLRVLEVGPGGIVTNTTSNAGEAYSHGVELEVFARPTEWADIGLTYTWQKNELSEYGALSGNEQPRSPDTSITLFGAAEWPLPGDAGTIGLDASVTYRSEFWTSPANSDPDFVRDKTAVEGLVNAGLTWTSSNEHLEVQLWGKNLTNEEAVASGFNWTSLQNAFYYGGPSSETMYFVNYMDPRTFGVTLRLRH